MPIDNVRLTAPTYDLDKDMPPFHDFQAMFLNFVDYQRNGRALITLAMNSLGRTFNHSSAFTASGMGAGLVLADEELAALDDELAIDDRALKTYGELTLAEKQLDNDLYSILSQCITGKHRVIIMNVQFRSFVQA